MDKQVYNKKGYILLELVVVLLVMSVLELLFLPRLKEPKLNSYNFMNEYLLNQSIALVTNKEVVMETYKYGINDKINFNEKANVNQARTINIDSKQVIITLGMGRIHE